LEEEQRSEAVKSRRKSTGANMFGALDVAAVADSLPGADDPVKARPERRGPTRARRRLDSGPG
jgi:hypothetical protein